MLLETDLSSCDMEGDQSFLGF